MKKNLNCPICSSVRVKFVFSAQNVHGKTAVSTKDKFSYYECPECKTVFIVGILYTKNYYKKYYNFKGYYRKSSALVTFFEKILKKISHKQKEKVILNQFNLNNNKIKILDVGAGQGEFLQDLDTNKFDPMGIEIDKKSYLISKQKDQKIVLGDVISHNFKTEKFDVITLWHVIEHVPYPKELIKKLKSILNKNGVIILATPNTDCLGYHLAKEKWYHTDAPRHVILYNKKSLEKLSVVSKMNIVKIDSNNYEFPLDLFWSSKGIIRFLSLFLKLFDQETIIFVLKK